MKYVTAFKTTSLTFYPVLLYNFLALILVHQSSTVRRNILEFFLGREFIGGVHPPPPPPQHPQENQPFDLDVTC